MDVINISYLVPEPNTCLDSKVCDSLKVTPRVITILWMFLDGNGPRWLHAKPPLMGQKTLAKSFVIFYIILKSTHLEQVLWWVVKRLNVDVDDRKEEREER